MTESSGQSSGGPWIYEDPDGRRYLVQLVPMEHDPTMEANLQPKAMVFQTDEGWIRVTPVGHDFTPETLSRAEILSLLQHAAGRPGGGTAR